jgi:hypothetical protein
MLAHSSYSVAAIAADAGPRNVAASAKTMNEPDTTGKPPVGPSIMKPATIAPIPSTTLRLLT